MRLLTTILLCAVAPLLAQTSGEKDALAAVQKTFDGIAAHDAAMIRSAALPEARVYSVRDQAAPTSIPVDEMASRIASTTGDLVERFTGRPSVSTHGRIAQVWGEYEFLRDGKFSHCGIDSFSLFKTGEGWKIAAIAYTVETTGCRGR